MKKKPLTNSTSIAYKLYAILVTCLMLLPFFSMAQCYGPGGDCTKTDGLRIYTPVKAYYLKNKPAGLVLDVSKLYPGVYIIKTNTTIVKMLKQ